MSNLLKYRFQRKDSDKIQPENAGKQSQSSLNSSQQSSQEIQSNLLTKRGAMVIASSDSETDSPVKQRSSPWLSKSVGMAMANGHSNSLSSQSLTENSQSSISTATTSQKSSPMATSSQTSTSGASSSSCSRNVSLFKEEERELYANLASLQEMYPSESRAKLVEALASCSNDVDQAIDWIIHKQKIENSKKRSFNRIRSLSNESDSQDSSLEPVYKKARQLNYSESQETTGSSQQNSCGMPLEEKLQFLKEAFPNFPHDILTLTLKSKDNNLEKASEALSSSGLFSRTRLSGANSDDNANPPKLEPMVSPPDNRGSIKAFRISRLNSDTQHGHSSADTSMATTSKEKSNGTGKSRKNKSSNFSSHLDDDDYAVSDYGDSSDSEAESAPSNPVLDFFNLSSLEELVAMDGCSKKKAETILTLRPFDNWDDLAEKLSNSAQLNVSLLSSCKEILRMRGVVRTLMHRCEKISSNMEYFVSEITGKTTIDEMDRGKGYTTQQPKSLNESMKLKPYQLVGLNWLNLMHKQNINGILGDEMGLGKTIQTIAFIAQLVEEGVTGTHVIIVPSSTVDNWLRELSVWCPSLKVMLYYGSQEERREVRLLLMEQQEECHVLVTTYNMASGTVEDRALFKKKRFHYAIFDEGHMLKNMSSMRYQSLMRINAERRLLLTGTPLQNNLVELMSLLAFVMPDLFTGKTDQVKKIFTSISSRSNYDTKGEYERQTISHAKGILKPFFLRRVKREVLQQLPSKVDLIEKVSMAYEQAELYDDLRNQFTEAIKEGSTEDGKKNKAGAGSAMLMQLRKAANHHLLHRRHYNETKLRQMAKLMLKEPTHYNANVDYVFEDMEVMSDFELHKLCLQYKHVNKFQLDEELIMDTGKFRYLDSILPSMKEKGDRVLLFSQFTMMLDIIEDYMRYRGYEFIRLDGQTNVAERQDLIDQFNTDTNIFVFLLSTKAGGLGINLTAANVVVLHDIDFNPYNDKQAEDRCHRVGQTRDVNVYKLISKNTIEEAMLRCGQAKLQLEQDVTGNRGTSEEENPNDVASLLKEALAIETDD